MLVRSGDLWHCTNPACLSELSIGTSRDSEVDHVYCVCGAVMKKHYKPPVFRGSRTRRSACTRAGTPPADRSEGVTHRPGYHLDLFYFYPTQKISGRRTSPQSCANASRLTGDDSVTAGGAKRDGKNSGKHYRKRLNQTSQIDYARGIAAK